MRFCDFYLFCVESSICLDNPSSVKLISNSIINSLYGLKIVYQGEFYPKFQMNIISIIENRFEQNLQGISIYSISANRIDSFGIESKPEYENKHFKVVISNNKIKFNKSNAVLIENLVLNSLEIVCNEIFLNFDNGILINNIFFLAALPIPKSIFYHNKDKDKDDITKNNSIKKDKQNIKSIDKLENLNTLNTENNSNIFNNEGAYDKTKTVNLNSQSFNTHEEFIEYYSDKLCNLTLHKNQITENKNNAAVKIMALNNCRITMTDNIFKANLYGVKFIENEGFIHFATSEIVDNLDDGICITDSSKTLTKYYFSKLKIMRNSSYGISLKNIDINLTNCQSLGSSGQVLNNVINNNKLDYKENEKSSNTNTSTNNISNKSNKKSDKSDKSSEKLNLKHTSNSELFVLPLPELIIIKSEFMYNKSGILLNNFQLTLEACLFIDNRLWAVQIPEQRNKNNLFLCDSEKIKKGVLKQINMLLMLVESY